jgi:hypothetical protein
MQVEGPKKLEETCQPGGQIEESSKASNFCHNPGFATFCRGHHEYVWEDLPVTSHYDIPCSELFLALSSHY